jgi:hypothetical protein
MLRNKCAPGGFVLPKYPTSTCLESIQRESAASIRATDFSRPRRTRQS